MCIPHHQLVLRWNDIAYDLTNGIKTKFMGLSYGNVIVREGLLGDHNLTPSTTIKGFIIMVDCAFKGHFFLIYFGIWQYYWYVHIIICHLALFFHIMSNGWRMLHKMTHAIIIRIVKRHVSHPLAICFGILNKKYYLL